MFSLERDSMGRSGPGKVFVLPAKKDTEEGLFATRLRRVVWLNHSAPELNYDASEGKHSVSFG